MSVCIPCRVITDIGQTNIGMFLPGRVIIISLIKRDQLTGTRTQLLASQNLEEIKTEKDRRCFSLKSAPRSEEPA